MAYNIYNITHYDLDGVGSGIALKLVYPNIITYPTGYNSLLSTVMELEQKLMKDDILFITDLQITDDCIMVLKEYIKKYNLQIIIYDHHNDLTESLCNSGINYNHSKTLSGTGLTFKHCYSQLKEKLSVDGLNYYNSFFRSIDSYDVWNCNSNESNLQYFNQGVKYNDLFWEYGFNKFLITYSNIKNLNKNTELRDMERIRDTKQRYFNDLVHTNKVLKNPTWCITFSDKYFSDIQLQFPGHKYYINITSKSNISLRVQHGEYNVIPEFIEFLKQYKPIRGGGHEYIHSTQLEQQPSQLIDIIQNFLKHFNENLIKYTVKNI